MLAYVAATRAKLVLETGGLGWVHDHLAVLAQPAGTTGDRKTTPSAEAIEAFPPTAATRTWLRCVVAATTQPPLRSPPTTSIPKTDHMSRDCQETPSLVRQRHRPSRPAAPPLPPTISNVGGFTSETQCSSPKNAAST